MFTFDPLTRLLTVSTTSTLKIRTYSLKYVASLVSNTVSSFTTFTVTVTHLCSTVVITRATDKNVAYAINTSALVISSLTYTENLGVCGIFTYSLINQDGTAYDTSVYTFDALVP